VEGSKTRELSTFVWCSGVAPAPSAPPLATPLHCEHFMNVSSDILWTFIFFHFLFISSQVSISCTGRILTYWPTETSKNVTQNGWLTRETELVINIWRNTFTHNTHIHTASSSSLVVPTFRLSTVGSRTFNVSDLGSGIDCPKKFRRRLLPVSSADLNPSSSHILILSSNCTFDTILVLVVMFIT